MYVCGVAYVCCMSLCIANVALRFLIAPSHSQTDWVGEMPLTYGEVPFESLRAVFERIKHYGGLAEKSAEKSTSLTFYDLGHGGGGACLAAACLFPFSKVVGIEVCEPVFVLMFFFSG